MKCIKCQKEIPPKRNANNVKYCVECRGKVKYRVSKEAQREYWYNRRLLDGKEKIQCKICGKWYRQVGTHITQVHGMTAREYREEFGFDVKRGQLPKDLREVKAEHAKENGTINNLKKGEKFWFKKGDKVGNYQRSQQTLDRLKQPSFKKYANNI